MGSAPVVDERSGTFFLRRVCRSASDGDGGGSEVAALVAAMVPTMDGRAPRRWSDDGPGVSDVPSDGRGISDVPGADLEVDNLRPDSDGDNDGNNDGKKPDGSSTRRFSHRLSWRVVTFCALWRDGTALLGQLSPFSLF